MNYETFKQWFFDVAVIILIWISLHYLAANIYPKFCAEFTAIGFIKSIFVATSPYCIALRWIIYNGGASINMMWTSIGIWITGKVFKNLLNQ